MDCGQTAGQVKNQRIALLHPISEKMPSKKHEWYKHGRCAIEDELIRNELGYFNVSLGLKKRTPILQ
ncbi:hypothetical protein AHF37_10659 [Paragonimus kellicotti]|nr:hypothetical protein AHF37_10659 [Paragonimus kellicotti]